MNALRFLFAIALSSIAHTHASEEWTSLEKTPDYELFRKPSSGSSDLVAFRIVGTISAPPRDVAVAILDRENRLKWMRSVRELRTVRVPQPGSVIEYSAVKTPFIIKDRDFVVRTDVQVEDPEKRIVITSRSVVDDEIPPGSDVRGEMTEGRFVIEAGEVSGTTRFTADMDVDPKGSVPRWIFNHFQKKWPGAMFRSLKRFVASRTAVLPEDMRPLFDAPRLDKAKR